MIAEWATNREKYPLGERRGPFLIVLISILLVLTFVIVGARLWARCRVRRNAGLDDLLIVVALVSRTPSIYLATLLTMPALPSRL